jgi:hypothetical protein
MEAHIAALLPTQNRVVSADENTAFLAHYDLNEHDVLRGVNAIGSQYALSFDGSTNYVRVANNLGSTSTFTISFWLKENGALPWSDIITIDNGDSSNAPRIERTNVTGEYRWYGVGGITSGDILFTHDGTKWENVTIVSDGTNVFCYKNGVQTYTAAKYATPIPATGYINIGRRVTSGNWKGSLMNVAFYNRALNLNEIKSVMNGSIVERGLMGFYRFNEGQDSIVTDYSAFHNDSTITGTATWVTGNSVFTLRNKEGYFGGGAIAVDESTTNWWTTSNLQAHGSKITRTNDIYNGAPVYYGEVTNPDVGNNFGFALKSSVTMSGVALTLTYSFWYKFNQFATKSGTANDMNAYIKVQYTDGTNQIFQSGSIVSARNSANWGSWFKYQYTFTTDAAKTVSSVSNGYFYCDNVSAGSTMYFTAPMLELKSFATSYVDGTRASGGLTYPKDIFNPMEGTISCWVYVDPTGPHSATTSWAMAYSIVEIVSSPYGERNQISLRKYTNATDWRFVTSNNAGTSSSISVGSPSKGWHMFTVSWGNGTLKGYLDGVLINTITGAALPSNFDNVAANALIVGSWTSGNYLNSLIDELRIDKIARTDAEIQAWYYSNSPFWPRGIYRKPY